MVNKKKLTAGVAALILCITGVTYGRIKGNLRVKKLDESIEYAIERIQ